MLAVFARFYTFLPAMSDDRLECQVPTYVRDELQACAYLAFVAITDPRMPSCPWVFSAHASPNIGGVVRAPLWNRSAC